MSVDHLKKEEIFNVVVDLTDDVEREAYLDDACAGDPQLREEIASLLKLDQQAGSFLESPPPGLAATIASPLSEKPGSQIGPYKLLQQIGEGGFGVVYMAEQLEPVRRKVALKIIKPGMDTNEVVARFEAERQALALMDHPNIARVFDGGTTDSGRPYFIMELVKGLPLTEYCDKNQLPANERLKLFAEVCRAVQHAHHKGIIHRDLKPSNVMVTMHDGTPVPKVIDFGVSKALNQQLTERTLFTAYGQMIGTPVYMSPEQAEMSGLDIDTRSDVYSLGVLLYELLTGTTPFETERLRMVGYAEMLRIIQEEEPPRPSTRLTTVSRESEMVDGKRGIDATRLSQLVRGELDWITMKALEKDRRRRYETAAGLADDVDRYLSNEAVHACPPTIAYRLRKFARRNKAALGVATAMALLLLAGITATTWQAVRAISEKNRAIAAEQLAEQRLEETKAALTEAEAVSMFLNDILKSPRPETVGGGRNVRVADLLDEAAKRLDDAEQISPERIARLRRDLAVTLGGLGLHGKALSLKKKVARYYLETRGPEDLAAIGSKMDTSISFFKLGRFERAMELQQEALATSRRALGPRHLLTIQVMSNLANSYDCLERSKKALEMREEALRLCEQEYGRDHTEAYFAMTNLALSYVSAGRLDEAMKLRAEALPLSQRAFPPNHPARHRAKQYLADSYERAGRVDEAREMREQILDQLVVTPAKASANSSQVLANFDEADSEGTWIAANDNVMGGRSKGGPSFHHGSLVFAGETVTQGGGFSSIRAERTDPLDLSFAQEVRLRVKGDGRTYLFEMRTKAAVSTWNAIPYRAEFATKAGQWIELNIPLAEMKPTLHGFNISGVAPPLDKTDIRSLGFMIYDKKDGEFRLEVDWIKAAAATAGQPNG